MVTGTRITIPIKCDEVQLLTPLKRCLKTFQKLKAKFPN